MHTAELTALLDATRQALVAFQDNQERTAAVHAEFLRAHAAATDSFSAMFDTHARLVELAAGSRPTRATTVIDAPVAPRIEATHEALAAAVIAPTASGRVTMPTANRPSVAAEDDLPPLLTATTLTAIVRGEASHPTAAPRAAAPAPAPRAAAPPPRSPSKAVDPGAVLMATVAEKTGYPPDLLDFGMDLESDLGIDSIKRVEIMAAVKDALPQLPDLDDETVGSLRTLADVRDHLGTLLASRAA